MKAPTNPFLRRLFDSGVLTVVGGHVFRASKQLKARRKKDGYLYILMYDSGRERQISLARVVCWFHHGPPPSDDHQVDHIDRNPSNNAFDNLRWSTPQENMNNVSPEERQRRVLHAQAMGKYSRSGRFDPIDEGRVREIKKLYADGVRRKFIIVKFNMNPRTLTHILNGNHWAHVPWPEGGKRPRLWTRVGLTGERKYLR